MFITLCAVWSDIIDAGCFKYVFLDPFDELALESIKAQCVVLCNLLRFISAMEVF